MINYSDLVEYLKEVARRNPNFNFVEFGVDNELINSSSFDLPAFIISPAQNNYLANAFINYGFQILYLDKMRQEEDNYPDILQDGFQLINSYLQVIDLKYKVIWGFGVDPFVYSFDGGILSGNQASILIEDQYNIDVTKSTFYNEND